MEEERAVVEAAGGERPLLPAPYPPQPAGEDPAPDPIPDLPLPPPTVYQCRLNPRLGVPRTRLRQRRGLVLEEPIPFCPATTNLTTLRGTILDRLRRFAPRYTWPADHLLFLKRTRHQPAENYEEMVEEGIGESLRRCYKEDGAAQFYVYLIEARAPRPAPTLRRATLGNIAVAQERIGAFLGEPANAAAAARAPAGGIGRAQWALNLARNPDPNAPVAMPAHAAFEQAVHIDAMVEQQRQIDQAGPRPEGYYTVGMRLNGAVIPVEVSVGDVRRMLGLPPYNLIGPVFHQPPPQLPPDQDMPDVDHASDSDRYRRAR